ncbi:hypothetical protein D3H65_19795 [Paraflavitalea soli]|uniref:DoxX family protein n=1 Tax=Paraflavitalea soli TaxID=2315862 RepID=A0A3B7MS12_9BACT|nr:hypothetical protein [Paraflavitalea soli]AXY76089.1 hypothetical protein D3H65_19795 [Paraflavitalea soli]
MKKNTFVEVIAALLLVFYVHSLISIYVQLQSLKNMLAFYTLHTSFFAWSFVVVELLIVIAIFLPKTRALGFILSATFAITLIITTKLTPGYPHDYGGLINVLSTNLKLTLLITITILSLLGFGLKLRKQKVKQQIPDNTVYT